MPTTPQPTSRLSWLIHAFGPVLGPARPAEILRTAFGAGLALLLCAAWPFPADGTHLHGFYLVAPLGASAVLLFAIPNSPLAQPWSVVVGNAASALVALLVISFVPQPALAAGLAAGLAILTMQVLRALHPPGGAVALTAALNPDLVQSLGVEFVAVTVFLGSATLVAMALAWHGITGRTYPFRQPQDPGPHGTADKAPQQRLGLQPVELAQVLTQLRQSENIGVADLSRLIAAAEELAAGHHLGQLTCADIMSRDLVTVAPDTPATSLAAIFAERGFSTIPVVGPDDAFLGVAFQLDLIRHFGRTGARPVSTLMSRGVAHVSPQTPAAALLPLLSDGGAEGVPVLEGERIVGIVTRTDLVSALARSMARDQAII